MRLSQYVLENGIDSFSFDDFLFVGQKLSVAPERLVLVGGQAIETWGHYFGVVAPTGQHEPLTEDTDFYGSKKDAIWLCNLLGKQSTELILNADFDASPNTALAYLQRPDGRVLMMDFLRAVVGLSHDDIVKYAVSVTVTGVKINVLHPLYCLESRLANIEKLPTKRNSNGAMQAEWAIDIVEAYLLKMRSAGAVDRDMIKACHQVAEASEYRSGPFCFQHFGIDPLRAISPAVLEQVGGRFVIEDWPRRLARINKKRQYGKTLIRYKVNLTPPALAPDAQAPAPTPADSPPMA